MFARVSRLEGLAPDRVAEMTQQFEEVQLDLLADKDGFEGVMVLVDRAGGQALGITLWSDEATLEATEGEGAQIRADAAVTGGSDEAPSAERYEVVLQLRRRWAKS